MKLIYQLLTDFRVGGAAIGISGPKILSNTHPGHTGWMVPVSSGLDQWKCCHRLPTAEWRGPTHTQERPSSMEESRGKGTFNHYAQNFFNPLI